MSNQKPQAQQINFNLMTRENLIEYIYAATEALQIQSLKHQLICCELQRVDKDNKIFDWTEGVIDKADLYLIRKTLVEGTYDKMRDKARIPRRHQAPGHQKEL